jgi:eukaryotic-like serine/threonine-protein kinase
LVWEAGGGTLTMQMKLEPGATVATRYRLDHCLGEGGMGTVWAATHLVMQRRHALKFVRGSVHGREELRRRFLREARAASAVDHPNVVRVHDVFELEDGTPVMVMDLLEGETLGHKLRREHTIGLEELAGLLVPVLSAVGTAHAMGVIHRDLKPDNIFLEARGDGPPAIRVLDFGIAKLTGAGTITDSANITDTGALLGTPVYMSPEQGFGERDIDHRTDIWALGVILYEALSGGRPVEGENLGQVLKRLLHDGITPLEVLVPDLPAEVTSLVNRMLCRERSERPADLREVSAVLSAFTTVTAPPFGAPDSRSIADPQPELPSTPRVVVDSGGSHDGDTMEARSLRVSTHGPTSISVSQKRPAAARYALAAAAIALAVGAVAFFRPSSAETEVTEGIDGPRLATAAAPDTPTTEGISPPLEPEPTAPEPEAASAEAAEKPETALPEDHEPPESQPSAAATARAPKTRPAKAPAAPAVTATPEPESRRKAPPPRSKGLVDEPPF